MKRTTGLETVVSVVTLFLLARSAEPCSVRKLVTPDELVERASVIAHVTAVGYSKPPEDPARRTTGRPDSRVRFAVQSVLKGGPLQSTFELPGYLSQRDDWNDREAPYGFVRPKGRRGSCRANTYKENGEFLLFLNREGEQIRLLGAALAPVNEQVRGPDDPWIVWVEERLRASSGDEAP